MKAGTKFSEEHLNKLRQCIDATDDVIDGDTLRLFFSLKLIERIDYDQRFSIDNPFIDLTSKGRLVLNTGSL
jgi:hypothetical protein